MNKIRRLTVHADMANISTAKSESIAESIIFNAPNVTGEIEINNFGGVFYAPKATVKFTGVGGGWLIANKAVSAAEWHTTNGYLPDMFSGTSVQLEAIKKLNDADSMVSGFGFNLYEKVGDGWTHVETVLNRNADIKFSRIYYNDNKKGAISGQQKEYIYKISESNIDGMTTIENAGTETAYQADTSSYYAKVVVKGITRKNSDNTESYGEDVISKGYYSDEECKIPLNGIPTFYNRTRGDNPADKSVSLKVKKVFSSGGWPSGKSFCVGLYKDAACQSAVTDSSGKDMSVTLTQENREGTFGPFRYNTAGTTTYYMKEIVPEEAENGVYEGVTYDTTVHTAVVTVSDQLTAAVKYDSQESKYATITNSYAENTSISVKKFWSYGDRQDSRTPESVQVRLLADNVATGDPVTLNAENGWSYKWSSLPKYNGDEKISYTVQEVNVPEGYSVTYGGTAADGFTITNTYDRKKTNVSVRKIWDDDHDSAGLRPESIQVQLYADGMASGSPVNLNGSNGWFYNWTNLDKYKDNKEITYTAAEVNVPEGYTMTQSGDAASGFTITNSRETKKTRTDRPHGGNSVEKQSASTTQLQGSNSVEKQQASTTQPQGSRAPEARNALETGDGSRMMEWLVALLAATGALISWIIVRCRRKSHH